ncbi:DUF1775 domain-containing protein [Cellulomonas phragmiteti]|uniref:YncI copper-binding domain-containing protein n=1 Tax=Cellulomonas phragmiteti TaxID=478780 RepID=A0ABQ4DIX7_9CELL|nr:DUF1775 domain-containing protein [Cellulomonas phragmiteti]GIG39287.1 hypothetical protein Cph01nite_10490 [Cellulomonas phragmiteti]
MTPALAPARVSRTAARRRHGRRAALVALVATAGVLAGASGAAAHVLIESVQPHGDGTSTVTLVFDHGCDGAPTRALTVTLPDGVEALAADQPPGWSADLTARTVGWHGTPVPDGQRAEYTLDVRVTGTVGQTFTFPTRQECTTGSYDWADTAPASEHPAPSFVATAATLSAPPPGPAAQAVPTAPLVAGVLAASAGLGVLGAWGAGRRRSAGPRSTARPL